MSTVKESGEPSDPTLGCGDDYKMLFDTYSYLSDYYVENLDFYKFVQSAIFGMFSKGTIVGERLLDLGSGPIINNHICAAKWFKELSFSDIALNNREALTKWRYKEADAFDWDPYFKYAAAMEGDENSWQAAKENFRKKMDAIYACDVRYDNPLHPVTCQPFDCVTSCFCLEQACAESMDYDRVIRNVTSLLKDGGTLILGNVLNERKFRVGDVWFRTQFTAKQDIMSALEKAGLHDICWSEYPFDELKTLTEAVTFYLVVAKK